MKKSLPECHGLVCVASDFVPSYYTLQAEEELLSVEWCSVSYWSKLEDSVQSYGSELFRDVYVFK